jgi:hypothetical protein
MPAIRSQLDLIPQRLNLSLPGSFPALKDKAEHKHSITTEMTGLEEIRRISHRAGSAKLSEVYSGETRTKPTLDGPSPIQTKLVPAGSTSLITSRITDVEGDGFP